MAYTQPVNFTSTGNYGCGKEDEDDVYTIEEFLDCVKSHSFIDSDGYGHPVLEKKCDISIFIQPSNVKNIPKDATHIVWYNN